MKSAEQVAHDFCYAANATERVLAQIIEGRDKKIYQSALRDCAEFVRNNIVLVKYGKFKIVARTQFNIERTEDYLAAALLKLTPNAGKEKG